MRSGPWSAGRVFSVAFLGLLAANAGTLTNPPYWDAVVGVFSQAVWLKDHGFDFFELARQPGYVEGGAQVSLLYLAAPLSGLLYLAFSPRTVFIILHVANIACAAVAFALLYSTVRTCLPWLVALAWCIAGAAHPIWSGQCASIYLEMPLAAALAAVFHALHRQRFVAASGWCLLAYFVKPSALIIGAALCAWFPVRLVLARILYRERLRTALRPGMLALLVPLPVFQLLNELRGSTLGSRWEPELVVWLATLLFPVLALLLLVYLVLAAYILLREPLRQRLQQDRAGLELTLVFAILVYGFWTSFALFEHPLCRYATLAVLPMTCLGGLLFHRVLGRAAIAPAVLLAGFGLINQYGSLLPSLPAQVARSGELLERSREYLLDLESNQRFVRSIEERFADRFIVTKYPFLHMLTLPEMGYVQKPLPNVVALGRFPTFAPVKRPTRAILQHRQTLYLYAPNVFEAAFRPSLRPRSVDTVVLEESALDGSIVLYFRKPRPAAGGAAR
jgi:hypothetical protein